MSQTVAKKVSDVPAQTRHFDVLSDPDFRKNGYVVAPFLEAERISKISDMALQLLSERGDTLFENVHVSVYSSDTEYKKAVDQFLKDQFSAGCKKLLPNYFISTASMFVKEPGCDKIQAHMDWTFVEGEGPREIAIWIPLQDVTSESGALALLCESYNIGHGPVGPTVPHLVPDGFTWLTPRLKPVPMTLGQALIFDGKMIHGSFPNYGETPRVAVRLSLLETGAQPVIHRQSRTDPGKLEIFQMSAEQMIEHSLEQLNSGNFKTEKLGECPQHAFSLIPAEFEDVLEHSDEVRAGRRTLESFVRPKPVPKPPSLAQRIRRRLGYEKRRMRQRVGGVIGRVRQASSRLIAAPDTSAYGPAGAPFEPFGDPHINMALQREGYATFDFLSASETNDLARRVAECQVALDRDDVHIPTRFELSAFSNDSAYKKRLYDAVWDCLRESVEAALPGYEPLVINLFDKPPGEDFDAVPIHQNPSFVEEPDHRSVSLWIPFSDVGQDNGTVGVMPGSHDRFNRMRAGNMEHETVFAPVQRQLEEEWFKPVEMKKGQMLALNDSILHWSYPNVSNRRRTAVQLIMVPKAARHIYYYYDNLTNPRNPVMEMYDVDSEFFFGFNCKARPETLSRIGEVPYRYRPLTEADLAPIISERG